MSSFVVTADAMGVPMAQIPLPLVENLTKLFPAEGVVVAYDHQTNHVQVNFPGAEAPAVQKILDGWSPATASCSAGFATWPGLHLDHSSAMDSVACAHGAPRVSTTGSVLTQMRGAMEGLTPAQQDRFSQLVCDLKTALAVEQLCLRKLFQAAPDGYVATDFDGAIEQANDAMYRMLQVDVPHLEGKSLLMFFTPHSKARIQQRLRLLRIGISEEQPFTDIQAQINLGADSKLAVSIRVIAIQCRDASRSTMRWLIRSVT